jgi:hypothetical protein
MTDIYNAASRGNPLDPRTIERLTKLLGLLGSSFDGERAAAALKADHLIRDHGLTWNEVIAVPKRITSPETLSELCGWLLGHSEILSPWEINFLQEISSLKSISPKQRDVLDAISEKVRGYRAAGGLA